MSSLADYNINNVKSFSLENMFIECRIIDIYDGDTCTCIIPVFNDFYKFNIRLADIDTCEMKSKQKENKDLALEARKRLCMLISEDLNDIPLDITRKKLSIRLNSKCYTIKIKCGDFDKYGRLLGWLFKIDATNETPVDQSLNYILINEKLAYKYEGKTKLTEEEQVNYYTKYVILNNLEGEKEIKIKNGVSRRYD
jgi:endonuclease YncB( thermonuclease family)